MEAKTPSRIIALLQHPQPLRPPRLIRIRSLVALVPIRITHVRIQRARTIH